MLELAIEKTIPTSLHEKPHRRRHVQEEVRPKKTKKKENKPALGHVSDDAVFHVKMLVWFFQLLVLTF